MPVGRHFGITSGLGGLLLIAALLLPACAAGPRYAKLSAEPVSDGLYRVEVRSPGALLVPPDHAEQRAAALEAGGYAIRACTVAFAGEHDATAIKPLQDFLSRAFCEQVNQQMATKSGLKRGEPAPGMMMLEAYLLNLDPGALVGDAKEVRFSRAMEARLYIKGTVKGRPALRYSEDTLLSRGNAETVLTRTVDSTLGNMSRIFGRLESGQPDVASP